MTPRWSHEKRRFLWQISQHLPVSNNLISPVFREFTATLWDSECEMRASLHNLLWVRIMFQAYPCVDGIRQRCNTVCCKGGEKQTLKWSLVAAPPAFFFFVVIAFIHLITVYVRFCQSGTVVKDCDATPLWIVSKQNLVLKMKSSLLLPKNRILMLPLIRKVSKLQEAVAESCICMFGCSSRCSVFTIFGCEVCQKCLLHSIYLCYCF